MAYIYDAVIGGSDKGQKAKVLVVVSFHACSPTPRFIPHYQGGMRVSCKIELMMYNYCQQNKYRPNAEQGHPNSVVEWKSTESIKDYTYSYYTDRTKIHMVL